MALLCHSFILNLCSLTKLFTFCTICLEGASPPPLVYTKLKMKSIITEQEAHIFSRILLYWEMTQTAEWWSFDSTWKTQQLRDIQKSKDHFTNILQWQLIIKYNSNYLSVTMKQILVFCTRFTLICERLTDFTKEIYCLQVLER